MARKKSFFQDWQENWASLVLGAVILVIVGLLIANFINRNRNQQIDNGEKTNLTGGQEGKMTSSNQYIVQAGDSLSKISQNYYQDESYWPVLAKANKIANPNIIFVDANLEIPSKEAADQLRAQMTQTSYKVEQGDTLFSIAEKMYGDGSKWPMIARANNLGKLPNGNPLVFAESTIKIPR